MASENLRTEHLLCRFSPPWIISTGDAFLLTLKEPYGYLFYTIHWVPNTNNRQSYRRTWTSGFRESPQTDDEFTICVLRSPFAVSRQGRVCQCPSVLFLHSASDRRSQHRRGLLATEAHLQTRRLSQGWNEYCLISMLHFLFYFLKGQNVCVNYQNRNSSLFSQWYKLQFD